MSTFSLEIFLRRGDDAFDASVATAWALCLSSFCPDKKVTFGYRGGKFNLNLEGETVLSAFEEILDFGGAASISRDPNSIGTGHNQSDTNKNLAISSAIYFTNDGIQDADTGVSDLVGIFESRSDGGVGVQVIMSSTLAPEVIMWAPYRLRRALEQIGRCSNGEELLSISLLSATEEKALERLGKSSGDHQNDIQSYLVHQLFEKQVLLTPHGPAIQFEDDEPFVYKTLNSMANRLARYILQVSSGLNRKENGIIALCLEKGVSMVVAILAVMKAGKAWVPLDPKDPRNRLDRILQAAQDPLIIVTRSTRHIMGGSPVIVLEEISGELLLLSPANLDVPTKPNDLCHVLFTSGSTGIPKGVMIEHSAMVNCVSWLTSYCNIDKSTRTLQFAAYTFDVCGLDIFMTLVSGGCLFLAPTTKLLADLNGFVRSHKINYAQLTPTVISLLVPSVVPLLKTLVSSGEALTESILPTWLGHARLINAYGPTETNLCTLHDVYSHPVPNCIGDPDFGMRILILDGHGRRAPIGVIGEICVAGPQLFSSYLGDPETTLKKKLTHAIGPLYKTGDLGCFDSDGRVYFHGRQDNQVKLLGNRVDLEEIEACISSCGVVRHTAVVVPQSGLARGRLAGFLSLIRFPASFSGKRRSVECLDPEFSAEAAEDLSDTNKQLLSELPSHMIPSVWFTLRNVPMTASGKVNRTLVREWVEMVGEEEYHKQVRIVGVGSNAGDISLTPAEERMRDIWSCFLSIPPHLISAESSFFEIGGNSISVIRMVSEARKAGFMISVQDVFANRRLSLIVKAQNSPALERLPLTPFCILPRDASPEIVRGAVAAECNVALRAVVDVYPCSPLQEGLMATSAKSGAYISTMAFRLPEIDPSRFRAAWEMIISSEEILRTRIVEVAPYGSLQAIIDVPVEWESDGSSVGAYLESMNGRGMDYGGRLCRFALILDNGLWHFVLTIHHAVSPRYQRLSWARC